MASAAGVTSATATSTVATRVGWTAHQASSNAPLLSVATADTGQAWAVGPGPTIVATTDGGATWASEAPATTNDLYGVTFADSADGWAVGPAGTVVATTDGGTTWAPQSVPTSQTLISAASRGQMRLGGGAPAARSWPPPTVALAGPGRARRAGKTSSL